jgi:hypothetical protein
MSIDPNQPADPPCPSVLMRAHSEVETSGTCGADIANFQGLELSLPGGSPGLDISLGASETTWVDIDDVKSALVRWSASTAWFRMLSQTRPMRA